MDIVIDVRSHSMAFEADFKRLNEAWISTFFWLEESDNLVLNDPQKYILDKGGNVFIALQNSKPVGTCALMAIDGITCELTKMVVDPEFHGQGIGYKLGLVFIEKAKARGFARIILEGNTKMEASIALYRKLGFREIPLELDARNLSVHKRCNIMMELILTQMFHPEYYI